MEKEKIELLKKILVMFNKARFDLTAPEMIVMSQDLMKFGQLIKELEKNDNKPIASS
jgi:hypothetical protein